MRKIKEVNTQLKYRLNNFCFVRQNTEEIINQKKFNEHFKEWDN